MVYVSYIVETEAVNPVMVALMLATYNYGTVLRGINPTVNTTAPCFSPHTFDTINTTALIVRVFLSLSCGRSEVTRTVSHCVRHSRSFLQRPRLSVLRDETARNADGHRIRL